jgi:hypothetical protein
MKAPRFRVEMQIETLIGFISLSLAKTSFVDRLGPAMPNLRRFEYLTAGRLQQTLQFWRHKLVSHARHPTT